MRNLMLQRNLFWEQEFSNHDQIASRHFKLIDCDEGNLKDFGRFSLRTGRRLKRKYELFDMRNIFSHFHQYMIKPENARFLPKNVIAKYWVGDELFIRPSSGFKLFGGDVFTPEKWDNTESLHRYLNLEESTLCFINSFERIDREIRHIFVGGEWVGSSNYMTNGDLDVYRSEEGVDLAKLISNNVYFINEPNFVVDVGMCDNSSKLIEINALESSSFYAADLELIFSKFSTYVRSI